MIAFKAELADGTPTGIKYVRGDKILSFYGTSDPSQVVLIMETGVYILVRETEQNVVEILCREGLW